MSKKQERKTSGGKTGAISKAERKARRDRRTTLVNLSLAAVFVLAILASVFYVRGLYLPWITVLSANDCKMDAVTFNYYYRDCYDSFQSAYGEMLDAYGTIDDSAGLDEQEYSSGYTWAEFFYDTALQNAERSLISYTAAQANGFELSEAGAAEVEQELQDLKDAARTNGYVSTSAFLRSHYGKGASLKSYRAYLLTDALANEFSTGYYTSVSFSDDELASWFADNYPDAGDSYDYSTVNFRLIYRPYEGYEYDEESSTYDFPDEEKQRVQTVLESVLAEYDAGAKTEDAFAALAEAYSAYNPTNGGLYENAVQDDSSVEADVRRWVFAEGREPGDVAYVAADSGGYLVYFVGEDMPAWQYTAQEGLRTQAWNEWFSALSEETEMDISPNIMRYLYYGT